jgi:hypothetical protein
MTLDTNRLLQHDAPIIRDGELPQDAARTIPIQSLEPTQTPARAIEIGGRDGPEPTRYGDWEKGGRCIDF